MIIILNIRASILIQTITVKILNIGTPKTITMICPKMEQVWLNNAAMCPKDADGMANSVEPDQTAPLGAV